MPKLRTPLALCLVAALSLQGTYVGRAAAQQEPSLADKESARESFAAGMELREKGDKASALAKFKAAYALVRSPITTLEVGRSYMALGQLIEAREKFHEVQKLPEKAGESKEAKAARVEAEKLADDLGAKIPSITIKIIAPAGVTPTVTVDGAAVPYDSLTSPRKVNPGTHVIVATGTGAERATVDVAVKEGETSEVSLKLEKTPGVTSKDHTPLPPGETPQGPASDTGAGMSSTKVLGLGIAGLGLVGVGVGVVLGLGAKSKYDDSAPLCPNDLCEPEGARLAADARSQGSTALIIGVIGGAALVGGTVLFLVAPSGGGGKTAKKSRPLDVAVSPTSFYLVGQF